MFIGHFGVGLGTKAWAPRVSLGTLFLAAQSLDLLWPTFLLIGLESVKIEPGITKVTPLDFSHYPISHSLLTVCLWGLLFGVLYWWINRETRGAIVIGLCVLTHWMLDLVVHRPDLPLHPGESARFGFGLWNSLAATLLLEGLIFLVGVILYLRVTAPKNRAGVLGFWALVVSLVLIYLSNILGPPPPSTIALAWVGQLQWLFVVWGYWVDRNRDGRQKA